MFSSDDERTLELSAAAAPGREERLRQRLYAKQRAELGRARPPRAALGSPRLQRRLASVQSVVLESCERIIARRLRKSERRARRLAERLAAERALVAQLREKGKYHRTLRRSLSAYLFALRKRSVNALSLTKPFSLFSNLKPKVESAEISVQIDDSPPVLRSPKAKLCESSPIDALRSDYIVAALSDVPNPRRESENVSKSGAAPLAIIAERITAFLGDKCDVSVIAPIAFASEVGDGVAANIGAETPVSLFVLRSLLALTALSWPSARAALGAAVFAALCERKQENAFFEGRFQHILAIIARERGPYNATRLAELAVGRDHYSLLNIVFESVLLFGESAANSYSEVWPTDLSRLANTRKTAVFAVCARALLDRAPAADFPSALGDFRLAARLLFAFGPARHSLHQFARTLREALESEKLRKSAIAVLAVAIAAELNAGELRSAVESRGEF